MNTRKTGALLLVPVLLVSLVLSAGLALAVHPDSPPFELDTRAGVEGDQDKKNDPIPARVGDGNTINDPNIDGDDWEDVYNGTSSALVTAFVEDTFANNNINNGAEPFVAARTPEVSFFTGGGSKDTNSITQWQYKTVNDQVPDKNDIVNAFAAVYEDEDQHTIFYFGLDTFSVNGDANAGFWFFREPVGLNPLAPGQNTGTFSGQHSDGDIFVAVAYTQGGSVGDIDVYEWEGDDATGSLVPKFSGVDCAVIDPNDPNEADEVCGVINKLLPDQTFGEDPVFDYANTLVANNPLDPTSYQYESAAFVEFGLDVEALLGEELGCFSTFLAETRSSQSATAQLKDLALTQFELCDANIQIEPDEVNEVGEDHTFTVTVNQVYAGVPSPAADATIVTVELTDANGAVSNISSDTCANPGTVNGECTVTFSSDSAGTVAGHASATVTIFGDEFPVETDGTGDNSDDAVKTYVDAYITIAADDTNEVGDPHTFTVTVYEDDGSGAGFLPAAGEDVDFTLTDSNGAASVLDAASSSCDDAGANTDASGQCTIVFSSNSAGQVTAHASSDVQVGGLSLSRQTDGIAPNSDDAVKTYVDGSLSWLKHDSNGNLLGGATFEVCRTHDRFGTDIADECVSVLDNNPPDLDPDDGEFLLDGLFLGRYTIAETVPPAGYVGDPFVETVELTLAAPDQSASYIWVNTLPLQGCTPGFWQGGAGSVLWDEVDDPQWTYSGSNPFVHTTLFNDYFNGGAIDPRLAGLTMYDLVSSGGTSDSARRAARDMVAAYLNESAFPNDFPAISLAQLEADWYAAVAGGDAALDAFHNEVGSWNDPMDPGFCPLP
ncbi:MAG: SpaA isopeptide-forming pilin-related protein [Anaerolineae bacterium]|nr:SpaA isopeptide-forming pilin-related protein [Anaerolineae bacterium]